jgi:hypothetical protein
MDNIAPLLPYCNKKAPGSHSGRLSVSKRGVGATSGRPQILQSKICRRKAKTWLFSFGKSAKLRFLAGDQ